MNAETNNRSLGRFRGPNVRSSGRLLLLAAAVGILVGGAAIVFDTLGHTVAKVTMIRFAGYAAPRADGEGINETSNGRPDQLIPWMIVVVMTTGGLASGWLVVRFAPDTAGPGTDAAIDAFHNRHGKIPARDPIIKTIASAIALGTGTSGGREGPICQIGAGIGSLFGQWLQLSTRDRRILLAAGMGAGVGAIFRAPLAGAMFAAEILYSDAEMEADVIFPAATSSIVAYSVFTRSIPESIRYQPLFGNQLQHSISGPLELGPYALLAVFLALVAIVYVRMFHYSQTFFSRLQRIPPMLRPALGAALAGCIGIGFFAASNGRIDALAVIGTGHGTLQQVGLQAGVLGAPLLLAIAMIKILTTSLTIGSGSPGGVFGPSMVIGGCFSAGIGLIFHQFMPNLVRQPEAFAIVGMAGFFAAVAHAPISTIIMVRALTGDFGLLVPTMLVTSITFAFAHRARLYRKQVPSRMDSPAHRGDFIIDVLEGVSVDEVYRPIDRYFLVHEAMSLDEIVHLLADNHQHYFPVVSDGNTLVGIFTDDDVRSYLYHDEIWHLANASDVMTTNVVTLTPQDDLNTAMRRFTSLNLEELPVLKEEGSSVLVGMLRRREAIATYNRCVNELKESVTE